MGDRDSDLERTNQALLRKLAQAEIAIDQLRVARYVARKRTFNTQSTGTVQAVQTDDPLLVDAVLELETEIEESVPLFVSGDDPVDDLQQLLVGLQGSFVNIERKSDSASSILTERVDGCKDKLDKMESALALKILDTSRAASSTSRGSSRAGSRCGRKSGANSVHGRSSCSGASGELNNGVCNTSSLLTGDLNSRDTSFDINGDLDVSTEFDTFLEDEERRMSSLHNSDFERDELLCKSESKSSLTELAELHEATRSDSARSGDVKSNNSLVEFLKKVNSKQSASEDEDASTTLTPKTTNFCCFPRSPAPGRRKKHKRSKSVGDKYKRCISVISDGTQTTKYEVSNVADLMNVKPSVAAKRSFTLNNTAPTKQLTGGLVRSQNNSNDSALGSSLSQKRDKRRYSTPNTKELSINGSVTSLAKPPLPGSTSNHSISSSIKNTMFCTPLSKDLGLPKEPVTEYKGTRGYDYAPSYNEHELEFDNMFNSKPGHKTSSRRSSNSHNSHSLYENIDQFDIAEPVKPPVPEHVPMIQRKRATARSTKSDETTPGYDSGYQDDSRRSSPNRTGSTGGPLAPDTRHRTLSTKSDISGVRDDVQELAARLRDLRTSIRSSSRSSSPSIPPERAQTTREALRERLRQLQCSSPGVGLDIPEQRTPRRSASPQRLTDPQELLNRSYPGYGPSRSHTYRMACPPPSMPSAPHPHSSSRNGSRSGSPRIARREYTQDNTRSPRSRSPCSHYSERDTRHMFYDVDHGQSRAYTPPLEVGVRIGSNIDMMQRQSRDIEQIRTQSMQSVEPYNRKYR